MTAHDDVRQMASDPGTDWETLHWIAENHPELRADVAGNPNTYPELLEALADLDDPEINAVLMRRFWPQEDLPPEDSAPTEPDPGSSTDPTAGAGAAAVGAAAGPALPGDDVPEDEERAAGSGAGATPAARRRQKRRRRAGLVAVAVVLPLIALGAIAALTLTLLGDRGIPVAEQEPETEDETTEPEETVEEEPEPTPEEEPEEEEPEEDTGPTVEEVQADLADLPEDSTCESSSEDSEAFVLLASVNEEEDSWDQEDEDLVQGTLEELRAQCGDAHTARVFQLLSGENAEDEQLSTSVSAMGTDWFDVAFPAGGAQELTRFMGPSGNVVCDIGEDLHCRVLEHSFAAPEGCEDGTTYRIRVDESPQPDCDNPVDAEGETPVLLYGDTAANGFFACTSFRSQMSCWNQLTGEGFNLSSTRNSTY